jgi:hypothetical protein
VSHDIFFIIDFLQTVFHIGDPVTALESGKSFGRLDLITGIAEGVEERLLIRGLQIQLTEDLTEGLGDPVGIEIALVVSPGAQTVQIVGVGKGEPSIRFHGVEVAIGIFQTLGAQEACLLPTEEYKGFQHGGYNGMGREGREITEGKDRLILHSLLQELPCAAVLLCEGLDHGG